MTTPTPKIHFDQLTYFLSPKYLNDLLTSTDDYKEKITQLKFFRYQLAQINLDLKVFEQYSDYFHKRVLEYFDVLKPELKKRLLNELFADWLTSILDNLTLHLKSDLNTSKEIQLICKEISKNVILIKTLLNNIFNDVEQLIKCLEDIAEIPSIKTEHEKQRLRVKTSKLNDKQKKIVYSLWDKYKNLDQFKGTAEMKEVFGDHSGGFAALFLRTNNDQHKDFYQQTFISHSNDPRTPKGYYKFSPTFQEEILKTNIS
jgi:hypothetical protein